MHWCGDWMHDIIANLHFIALAVFATLAWLRQARKEKASLATVRRYFLNTLKRRTSHRMGVASSAPYEVAGKPYLTACEALAAHQPGDDIWIHNASDPTHEWTGLTFEELKYMAKQEQDAPDPEEVP